MISTTLSDFRSDIKHYADEVIDNYETIIINRGKDKGLVVISLQEFNSWRETMYLNSTKANREILSKSIEELNSGKAKLVYKTIEELKLLEK